MKKNLIFVITPIIILFVVILVFLTINSMPTFCCGIKQCDADKDCQLVYDSCSCEAVPSEWNVQLGRDKVCIWNECIGKEVKAICRNNKCTRSDK